MRVYAFVCFLLLSWCYSLSDHAMCDFIQCILSCSHFDRYYSSGEVSDVLLNQVMYCNVSCIAKSTNKGINQRSKYVTEVQQQRPESPTVLTWRACKYKYINSTRGFSRKGERSQLRQVVLTQVSPPKKSFLVLWGKIFVQLIIQISLAIKTNV